MRSSKETRIGIIGLGYVGLPLAVEFGKKIRTVGFDINKNRIKQLESGLDISGEISKKEIATSKKLFFSYNIENLRQCNFFIIAVPTPVDKFKSPDFTPLEKVSELVGKIIKKNDVVVYESTVYPGATEDVCVPILEKNSGLSFNNDFYVGYSPERISPADKNKVSEIIKITSGSTIESGKYIDNIYRKIIKAGTFLVEDMKIAEACKVIENTQRDVNIALMNEISIFLNQMNLNTLDVIAAMRTKWNALSFVPGLVGGHCIGVDPQYLIYKAQAIGCNLNLIENARAINDGMPKYIAKETIAAMCRKKINPVQSKILILGTTFKENCTDIRNARPFDIANELEKYGSKVDIFDPIADKEEVFSAYKIKLINTLKKNHYDAIILAVAHNQFRNMGVTSIKKFGKNQHFVFYDIKSVFEKKHSDISL